jgi:hypothetical protein
MVVVKPEATMTVIPRESEVTWAYEFASFGHNCILPLGTDILRLNHCKKGENSEQNHDQTTDFSHNN